MLWTDKKNWIFLFLSLFIGLLVYIIFLNIHTIKKQPGFHAFPIKSYQKNMSLLDFALESPNKMISKNWSIVFKVREVLMNKTLVACSANLPAPIGGRSYIFKLQHFNIETDSCQPTEAQVLQWQNTISDVRETITGDKFYILEDHQAEAYKLYQYGSILFLVPQNA